MRNCLASSDIVHRNREPARPLIVFPQTPESLQNPLSIKRRDVSRADIGIIVRKNGQRPLGIAIDMALAERRRVATGGLSGPGRRLVA